MIRAVVFDFDGTLVDSNGIKAAAMNRIAAKYPAAAGVIDAGRQQGDDRYVLFAKVARHLHPAMDAPEQEAIGRQLAAEFTQDCATGIRAAPERRGARHALARIFSRGIPIYLSTGTPRQDILPLLRARGLSKFFRGVFGAPAEKADNLRCVMSWTRARPNEVVLIGDSMDYFSAAKETGVHFVAVDTEKRIDRPVRHAMADLRRLMPLIDSLDRRRARP